MLLAGIEVTFLGTITMVKEFIRWDMVPMHLSQMLHGAGVFAYIYPKNGQVM